MSSIGFFSPSWIARHQFPLWRLEDGLLRSVGLGNARGVIVINSTVGFSALHHNTPVKVCGRALFDLPGLTFQGCSNSFWKEAIECRVDRDFYKRFRSYLIEHSQLNGSFYKRLNVPGSYSGLHWVAQGKKD